MYEHTQTLIPITVTHISALTSVKRWALKKVRWAIIIIIFSRQTSMYTLCQIWRIWVVGFLNQPDFHRKLRLAFQFDLGVLWGFVRPQLWCAIGAGCPDISWPAVSSTAEVICSSVFIKTFEPFQDLHELLKLHFSSDFFQRSEIVMKFFIGR